MKYYCKCCHRIFEDEQMCPYCKQQVLSKGIGVSDPVTVVSAAGIEKDRITAVLDDLHIPYATRAEKREVSAPVLTGIDSARYRIEIPYSYYGKTMDALAGIKAVDISDPDLVSYDIDDKESAELHSDEYEEYDEMSPRKRMIVRVISVILFILAFALVINGTDFITGLIKGLFK